MSERRYNVDMAVMDIRSISNPTTGRNKRSNSNLEGVNFMRYQKRRALINSSSTRVGTRNGTDM